MSHYLITGAASGIGAAIKTVLERQGDRVTTLDLKDADICIDLGDPDLRDAALAREAEHGARYDGIVTCAGVASHFPDPTKITEINFFGSIAVIEALRHNLNPQARILMMSSNSAPQSRNDTLVDAMLQGDRDATSELASASSGHEAYASSKLAVAKWVRRAAPVLATEGITINAIAPGYIETNMTLSVAQSETYGQAIKDFVASIPIGRSGQPDDIAHLTRFLLSPEASFITGSVLFIDGGHDALFRPTVV
jgi:NAD(P)-dependent dehydrogenase (short-subunit alcohol dehydrogenase family)